MFCPFSFCNPHAGKHGDRRHGQSYSQSLYEDSDEEVDAYSPGLEHKNGGSHRSIYGRSRTFCTKNKNNNMTNSKLLQQEERIRQLQHACQWRSADDPSTGRTYYFHLKTQETTWDKPIELATGAEKAQLVADLKAQKEWFANMEQSVKDCLALGKLPGDVVTFDPNEPVRTRDWALRRSADEDDENNGDDVDDDQSSNQESKSFYSECDVQAEVGNGNGKQPCSALGAINTVRTSSTCSSEDSFMNPKSGYEQSPPSAGQEQRRRKTRRQPRHSHVRTISSMDDTLLVQLKSQKSKMAQDKSGESKIGNGGPMVHLLHNNTTPGVDSNMLPPLHTIFSGEENNGWTNPCPMSSPEGEQASRAMTPSNVEDIFRAPSNEEQEHDYEATIKEEGSACDSSSANSEDLKFTTAAVLLQKASLQTCASSDRAQDAKASESLIVQPTAIKAGALRDSFQARRSSSKKSKKGPKKLKSLHSRSHTMMGDGASASVLYKGTTMVSPDDDKTITCICGVYRAHVMAASVMPLSKLDLDTVFHDDHMEAESQESSDASKANSCPELCPEGDDSFGSSGSSSDSRNSEINSQGSSFNSNYSNCNIKISNSDVNSDGAADDRNDGENPQGARDYSVLSKNQTMTLAQAKTTVKHEVPVLDEIVDFVKHIYYKGKLESECLITCLVYVERLMRHSSGRLRPHPTNWKSVLLSSLVLSSKVLDDLSMWNVDFSKIMSTCQLLGSNGITLERINALEIYMLDSVGYHVKVSVSEYGKYYFLLRSMWQRSEEKREKLSRQHKSDISNSNSGDDAPQKDNILFQGAKLLEQSSAKYEKTLLANSHTHHHTHNHPHGHHGHSSSKRRTQSMNDCDMRHGRCFSPVVFLH